MSTHEHQPISPTCLPPLPYTLHSKKRSIAIHWTIILLPTCILPLAFYFGLRYSGHIAAHTGEYS